MGFARHYFFRQGKYSPKIPVNTPNNLRISIIIPVYNEPDFFKTIVSLFENFPIHSGAEIIAVINAPESAPEAAIKQNQETLQGISAWKKQYTNHWLKIHVIYAPGLPKKFAGAGLARKTGMDEAVYRFQTINNPDGIIVSLDADVVCEKNYLLEIEKFFDTRPDAAGCNINFEHPVSGNEFPLNVYDAIVKYELYLRFYRQGLKFCGFPYPFHTMGSAFAVKAGVYAQQGGMNKQQGGEDFYFLNKIFPQGNFHEITTTTVIPSPRTSGRVPFGTGQAIQEIIRSPDYLTYNFQAFRDLKILFSSVYQLFQIEEEGIADFFSSLPLPVTGFLKKYNAPEKITEINRHTASETAFIKRFFNWFSAFRIVKFLNESHRQGYYHKLPVETAAAELLREFNFSEPATEALELLEIFRGVDR